MRLDTANRSFAGLVGVSHLAGLLAFCGAIGCVLFGLMVARMADGGVEALASDEAAFWPALAFIAIVGAGAAFGLASLRRQVRASRELSARVGALELPLPPGLEDAAQRNGLAGRVILLDSGERFSFVYGAFTPRVAVSRGLFEAASQEEFHAVLEHERYHVRNLDPLKVLLSRALTPSFFYVPVLEGLHRRYVAGRELAADRRALDACGRKPLAGVLYKVVRGPSWPELQASAAIGGSELLDARVAQLERGEEPPMSGVTARAVLLSLLGAGLLISLFVLSVLGFGGLTAVADLSGGSIAPLDAVWAVLCAVPWAVGGWLGYRWLARRTRRRLDMPSR